MRSLETIANATPKDYLSYGPSNPEQLALQMIHKAENLSGSGKTEFSEIRETNHTFLYVGPGSGLVVKSLIDQGHIANGLETSKRGIRAADPNIISYCNWSLPWETPFRNKYFDVALVNNYLSTILEADEWQATIKEIKRVSRYASLVN